MFVRLSLKCEWRRLDRQVHTLLPSITRLTAVTPQTHTPPTRAHCSSRRPHTPCRCRLRSRQQRRISIRFEIDNPSCSYHLIPIFFRSVRAFNQLTFDLPSSSPVRTSRLRILSTSVNLRVHSPHIPTASSAKQSARLHAVDDLGSFYLLSRRRLPTSPHRAYKPLSTQIHA